MNLFTTIFQPKKHYSSLNIDKVKPFESFVFYIIPVVTVTILTVLYIEFSTSFFKESTYQSKKEWLIILFLIYFLSAYFMSRLLSISQQKKYPFYKILYIISPTIFISIFLSIASDIQQIDNSHWIPVEFSLTLLFTLFWIIYVVSVGIKNLFDIEFMKSSVIFLFSLMLGIISTFIIRELYFLILKLF